NAKDPSRAFSAIAVGLAWTLLSAVPLLGEFYVGPDLQGSRYAYLPLAGFSLALAGALAASSNEGFQWIGSIGSCAMCVAGLLAWPVNVASWQAAAATRDALIMDAQRVVFEHGCSTLEVRGAPDNVQGAYVFRQGLPVALRELHYAHKGSACIATWKSDKLFFAE